MDGLLAFTKRPRAWFSLLPPVTGYTYRFVYLPFIRPSVSFVRRIMSSTVTVGDGRSLVDIQALAGFFWIFCLGILQETLLQYLERFL